MLSSIPLPNSFLVLVLSKGAKILYATWIHLDFCSVGTVQANPKSLTEASVHTFKTGCPI